MKTFKEVMQEEAPANAVGTADKTSVAGAPIKRKGIGFVRRFVRNSQVAKNQRRERQDSDFM
jgi:hypothetical protein